MKIYCKQGKIFFLPIVLQWTLMYRFTREKENGIAKWQSWFLPLAKYICADFIHGCLASQLWYCTSQTASQTHPQTAAGPALIATTVLKIATTVLKYTKGSANSYDYAQLCYCSSCLKIISWKFFGFWLFFQWISEHFCSLHLEAED